MVSDRTQTLDRSASRTAARILLRGSDLLAIAASFSLTVFMYLALFSLDAEDPSLFHAMQHGGEKIVRVHNLGGKVGAEISGALVYVFGYAAWIVPLFFVVLAVGRLYRRRYRTIGGRLVAAFTLMVLTSALLAIGMHKEIDQGFPPGGWIGDLIGKDFFWAFFSWGSWVFLLVLWVLMFVWSGGLPVVYQLWLQVARLGRLIKAQVNRLRAGLVRVQVWMIRHRRERSFRKEEERAKALEELAAQAGVDPKIPDETPQYQTIGGAKSRSLPAFTGKGKENKQSFDSVNMTIPGAKTEIDQVIAGDQKGGETIGSLPAFTVIAAKEDAPTKPAKKQLAMAFKNDDRYTLPAYALLDEAPEFKQETDEKTFKAQAQILQGKLKDFGVRGTVEKAHAGPVITVFEFRLAAGTRVNQLTKLEEDLALGMASQSVRICRFPNRDVMGIEIPAMERQIVPLRTILEHEAFRKKGTALPVALGKDVFGEPTATDLAKMPHMLIGGSTGSGKSVGINSLLLSLLFKLSPDELKLFLIDPKRLELAKYENIPHLGYPVVTEAKEAVGMLRMLVRIMTARYDMMAQAGVRNISGYNKAVKKGSAGLPEGARAMPYIVCIVDELADLMMLARKDVEEPIARLAQMARAAGIHLVLATQRPSVDVITGLIKSNFPARIAFKVTARVDSKTILDEIGGQNLLGKGDMLFLDPTVGTITRIHGTFVSDEEVDRVCDFWREQGEPEPMFTAEELAALAADKADDENGSSGGPIDKKLELYEQAVALAIRDQEISISRLQRVLEIGYNRAANLIDRMEEEGIIGPPQGAGKRRQVLIKSHELADREEF